LIASKTSRAAPEAASARWFADLLGAPLPVEGGSVEVRGHSLTMKNGILRARELLSAQQDQTKETFAFKWAKRDTFEGELTRHAREWLIRKYGDIAKAPWLAEHGPNPIILDAGCGASVSALAILEPVLPLMRYLGVDVSEAIDVAQTRFAERGLNAEFIQADLQQLPLPDNCVDLIFSEGVLHHTDNTRAALTAVVRHLKPGGRIIFYVYRRKGPIREFTDDYVRKRLQTMSVQEAWDALLPLSRFGKVLGDLDITIDVPGSIDLLEIPAGPINLQRLFYWHVFKIFYQPQLTLDEMNHVNFDWYAPLNAHRQTPEELREWCNALSLHIEHEFLEEAGISIIARKAGHAQPAGY